jgi:hypothetical protein
LCAFRTHTLRAERPRRRLVKDVRAQLHIADRAR